MGVVSFCLSCQDASTDMQHYLLESTQHVTSGDLDLRPDIDLTVQGHQIHVSTCLDEMNTVAPELSR